VALSRRPPAVAGRSAGLNASRYQVRKTNQSTQRFFRIRAQGKFQTAADAFAGRTPGHLRGKPVGGRDRWSIKKEERGSIPFPSRRAYQGRRERTALLPPGHLGLVTGVCLATQATLNGDFSGWALGPPLPAISTGVGQSILDSRHFPDAISGQPDSPGRRFHNFFFFQSAPWPWSRPS